MKRSIFKNPKVFIANVILRVWCGFVLIASLAVLIASGACTYWPAGLQATQTSTAVQLAPTEIVVKPRQAKPVPGPQLFAEDWTDAAPYIAAINPADQSGLTRLADAPIYHMDLVLDDSLTKLSGRMEVRYTNRQTQPLNEIYFRLFPNLFGGKLEVLQQVQVDGKPVEIRLEEQDSALRVILPSPLAPGNAAVILMNWQAEIPQEGNSNYNTYAYAEGVLALGQFYPLIPAIDQDGWYVRVPPQFGDVPFVDASFFRVRISTTAEIELIGSGQVNVREDAGGKRVFEFNAGPGRDFYLAGARQLACRETQEQGLTMRVCGLGLADESLQQSLAIMTEAVAAMSADYRPYPYAELEVIATPTSALGVEYPGVIAINQRLFDPVAQFGEISGRVMRETTLVHEIAHQWFYNLIGNDQVDEPWLDEALAQYATYQFYRDERGAGEALRQSFESRWDRVERAATPIGLPVYLYTDRDYGAIVYGRGPLFIIALEEKVGSQVFERFLKQYADKFAWKNVDSAAFQGLLEENCGCSLDDLFREWVYE